MRETVWIGMGCNQPPGMVARESAPGDHLLPCRKILCRALETLANDKALTLLKTSALYRSEPVGGEPQPDYLNAAISLETERSPHELLSMLQQTEQMAGRDRRHEKRWGPRPLDLDILLYGQQRIKTPDLTIPHPRAHLRRFVLTPLAEIDGHMMLPGVGKTVDSVLDAVDDHSRVIPWGRFQISP